MAASRANPTVSSSSRKVCRAKETTIMKWPVSSVGCTDLLKVRWISDANFIPGEKSNPKESASVNRHEDEDNQRREEETPGKMSRSDGKTHGGIWGPPSMLGG